MCEFRERGCFVYVVIVGKYVSEESKGKKYQKKDFVIYKYNVVYKL